MKGAQRGRGAVMRDSLVTQVNGPRAPSVPTADDLALFIKIFNVYLFLRQRETEHEWGRVRETDTESETGSRL